MLAVRTVVYTGLREGRNEVITHPVDHAGHSPALLPVILGTALGRPICGIPITFGLATGGSSGSGLLAAGSVLSQVTIHHLTHFPQPLLP
ncbi:MAG: hypothetical protein IPK73_14160 [Candidatus Obscuribacter sp.]|nr:hypothetical protein [Candidatus Obscuribacter sp.]